MKIFIAIIILASSILTLSSGEPEIDQGLKTLSSNNDRCEIPRSWARLGSNIGVPTLIPGRGYMFTLTPRYGQNTGPWHAFYALTRDTYFNIKPTSLYWCTVTPQILSTETLKDVPFKLMDRPEDRPTLKPEIGITLARRMVGRVLVYRMCRCNCRHYTDYLLHGRTHGLFWDLTYNSNMSKDCPFHRIVTDDDDVNSDTFTLKDGWNKPIELGPPIIYDDPLSSDNPSVPEPGSPNAAAPSLQKVSVPGMLNGTSPGSRKVSPPGSPRASPPGSPRASPPGSPRASPPGSPRASPPGSPKASPGSANGSNRSSPRLSKSPQRNRSQLSQNGENRSRREKGDGMH